jgi:hypothetical protein
MQNVLTKKDAYRLSPIGVVQDTSQWNRDGWLNIAGVQSLRLYEITPKI